MKSILNITELALLYYEQKEPELYKDADEQKRVVARVNFRKRSNYDARSLKVAKAEYIKRVKEELNKITP